MVATTFAKALALVLKSEGGNDDDPADRGGRTSRGITQREYDAWRAEHNLPQLDVWQAPQSDIDVIYHEEYWEPWCDIIPAGTDYMFFDTSVLSGQHEAILLLQRAINVPDDGRIGPVTRTAIQNADAKALIATFSNEKRAFYRAIVSHNPSQTKFIRGWLNRTNTVEQSALAMLG